MVGNANSNSIPFLHRRGIDVSKIMDSMVLWYDIKKQLEQYNVPKYIVDFTKGATYGNNVIEETEGSLHITYLAVTTNNRIWAWEQQITYPYNYAENVIEVKGLPEGMGLKLNPNENSGTQYETAPVVDIPNDGIYTIPAVATTDPVGGGGFAYLITYAEKPTEDYGECDITITQVASIKTPNEYFAEVNKLIDLSGNGHDATCYNFAWSGMSGVGGYGIDASEIKSSNNSLYNILNNGNEIIVSPTDENSNLKAGVAFAYYRKSLLSEELTLYVGAYGLGIMEMDASGSYITIFRINPNETATFHSSLLQNENSEYIFFTFIEDMPAGHSGTFGILPEYPNALVSDGVDDYCLVEGLPLLNKEDGYTVIAKREIIDKDKINCIFAVKGITAVGTKQNAFAIDIIPFTGDYYYQVFGANNLGNKPVDIIEDIKNDNILICTTKNINNYTVQVIGNTTDEFPYLYLLGYPGSKRFINSSFYSFLLFDRDLTEQEIDYVKKHLIGVNDNSENEDVNLPFTGN